MWLVEPISPRAAIGRKLESLSSLVPATPARGASILLGPRLPGFWPLRRWSRRLEFKYEQQSFPPQGGTFKDDHLFVSKTYNTNSIQQHNKLHVLQLVSKLVSCCGSQYYNRLAIYFWGSVESTELTKLVRLRKKVAENEIKGARATFCDLSDEGSHFYNLV